MEQVFDGLSTTLRALLGLLIVIGPGMLFWLIVVGVTAGVRWVTRRGSVETIETVQEGAGVSSPSTVKS
jgi:hypothetical protein